MGREPCDSLEFMEDAFTSEIIWFATWKTKAIWISKNSHEYSQLDDVIGYWRGLNGI